MPSHPLFSDNTIALSATLAATIGLEEAVLLTVLNDAARQQSQSYARINNQVLRMQLPFWDDVSIRRVLRSLCDKGLIALQGAMFPDSDTLIYTFSAQQAAAHTEQTPAPPQAVAANTQSPANTAAHNYARAETQPYNQSRPGHQKEPLSGSWQPQDDTLQRLEQHGIPRSFSCSQLDTFMLAGQEQGANRNDWNTRFFRHVKTQWVYQQNDALKNQRACGAS